MKMNTCSHALLCLLFCVSISGCASLGNAPQVSMQDGGLIIYATDGDQQTLYIKDIQKNDSHRFCLTPSRDAVSGKSEGIGLSVMGKEGISVGDAKGELALGGRSPSVLIARELMYRACEVTSNLNTDTQTTLKVYERFLQAIEKISMKQTESGSAPLSLNEQAPNVQMNAWRKSDSDDGMDDENDDDNGDDDSDDDSGDDSGDSSLKSTINTKNLK